MTKPPLGGILVMAADVPLQKLCPPRFRTSPRGCNSHPGSLQASACAKGQRRFWTYARRLLHPGSAGGLQRGDVRLPFFCWMQGFSRGTTGSNFLNAEWPSMGRSFMGHCGERAMRPAFCATPPLFGGREDDRAVGKPASAACRDEAARQSARDACLARPSFVGRAGRGVGEYRRNERGHGCAHTSVGIRDSFAALVRKRLWHGVSREISRNGMVLTVLPYI